MIRYLSLPPPSLSLWWTLQSISTNRAQKPSSIIMPALVLHTNLQERHGGELFNEGAVLTDRVFALSKLWDDGDGFYQTILVLRHFTLQTLRIEAVSRYILLLYGYFSSFFSVLEICSSNITVSAMELAINEDLWNFAVSHSDDMSSQFPLWLHEKGFYASNIALSEEIRDSVSRCVSTNRVSSIKGIQDFDPYKRVVSTTAL